jgi:hypothetical protein
MVSATGPVKTGFRAALKPARLAGFAHQVDRCLQLIAGQRTVQEIGLGRASLNKFRQDVVLLRDGKLRARSSSMKFISFFVY